MAIIPTFPKAQVNRLSPLGQLPTPVTTFPLPSSGNGKFTDVAIPFGASSLFGHTMPKDQASINFKVRLVSVLEMIQGAPGQIKQVIFEVTPTLSESRTVDYSSVQPIHMPGGIQVYKSTGSRTFELAAHFISRNTKDALLNMQYVQILRSWTMPFFGNSTTDFTSGSKNVKMAPLPTWHAPLLTPDQQLKAGFQQVTSGDADGPGGVNLLGAPPEVLYLYGYSASSNDSRGSINRNNGVNINRIPTVLTSLNISFSDEVDYIPVQINPTANTEPFPVKLDVTMTLVETHSPTEYEQFSLKAYKNGTLKNF